MRDLCLFRSVYQSDPNEETLATFYGMLDRIPEKIKEAWGYGGTFEERAGELVEINRLETLGD